jgi:hypothetical protein
MKGHPKISWLNNLKLFLHLAMNLGTMGTEGEICSATYYIKP